MPQVGRAERFDGDGVAVLNLDRRPSADELGVVHVAGVDQRDVLGRRDRCQLAELVDRGGIAQRAVPIVEFGQGHRAHVGLERPPAPDQPQHLVIVHAKRLHTEVVDRQERRQPARIRAAQVRQPAVQLIAERLTYIFEQGVLVERLAAGGRTQFGRVDHGPDEERPLRQQPFDALGQQHLLEVDPMRDAHRRIRLDRQHERDALEPCRRYRELDHVKGRESEDILGIVGNARPVRDGRLTWPA
jgi:hypothetical protein